MRTCEEKLWLLHRLAEGLLDPDEARELGEHVDECEFCSSEMEEFSRIKSFMEKGLDKALTVPKIVDGILAAPPKPGRRPGRMRFALKWAGISFATVAAMIALLVVGYLYSRGFIGPKPVAAKLAQVSVAGEKWVSHEKTLRGGAVVRTEAKERRSLRLNSGVVVVLNEDTSLEVESENSLELHKGEIYIDTVKRKGVVLRIKTGQAVTYVTGTQLGVSAMGEETSIVVEEGSVSVQTDWGEQVVVLGNIYRIIESMKPEPPELIDVEEMFSWVQERAYLSGMVVEAFEDAPDGVDDEELIREILYGLRQSRQAIQSGDVTFDVLRTSYGFGFDLTEDEQDDFTEHVVAGQIAQLDEKRPPSEERFKEIVQDAADAAMVTNDPTSTEETLHWIFHAPDKAMLEKMTMDADDFETDMIVNGDLRYKPGWRKLERCGDGFRIKNHPAYFGRSRYAVSELENPRILGTEDLDGVTTYLLEADVGGFKTFVGEPTRGVIQMWVDPAGGYIVPKSRVYVGMEKYNMQTCYEMIAEDYDEVAPGVRYPYSLVRNVYSGEMVMGEQTLKKLSETVFTLSHGDFNMGVPGDAFDIPNNLPVVDVDRDGKKLEDLRKREAEKLSRMAEIEEYLRDIYGELRQIKQFDDPTAPGSRKLILRISKEDKNRSKGAIYTSAFHRGEVVGALVLRVDPVAASYWPTLPGDIIYTLNDEPWLVSGPADVIRGIESLIPIINAGRPITIGLRRNGELRYIIVWVD